MQSTKRIPSECQATTWQMKSMYQANTKQLPNEYQASTKQKQTCTKQLQATTKRIPSKYQATTKRIPRNNQEDTKRLLAKNKHVPKRGTIFETIFVIFFYRFFDLRRAVFRHPYRGFALALSKTHGFLKVRARILDRGSEKQPGGETTFSLRNENSSGF